MNKNINLLTEKECASLLKISRKKLQKDRYNKVGIAYVKIGGSIKYQYDDIIEYVDKNLIKPTMH